MIPCTGKHAISLLHFVDACVIIIETDFEKEDVVTPIPFDADLEQRIMNAPRIDFSPVDEAACGKEWAEDHAKCDEELKRWLFQYDDSGRLKPGIFGTRRHIPNRAIGFLSMSDDKKAAFIVSEKKRMGLLRCCI